MSRSVNQNDDYMSRLLKNIPSEIVGVYIAASGVIPADQKGGWMLWAVFAICLVCIPLWLYFMQEVKSWLQIILTLIAFIIWIMTLGGPFLALWPQVTLAGSILLILYTGLIAPILAGMIN